MHVLIALSRLLLGGSETYSVTVGEQLERLGHTVTLHASEASSGGRELAESRSLPVRVGDSELPDDVDVALVQDAASAYMLAARRPGVRQVFVIHGLSGYEHPPDGLDPTPPIVVFNDRIGGHAKALAWKPTVVRMHQPIDFERFRPRGSTRPRAQTVLVLSNYLKGERLEMLERACSDLDLELTRLGANFARPTIDPREAMADADIVIGYGRSVIEGMAMGCAAYVWDYAGGDGWVTPETYPMYEADGFAGAATERVIDADGLRDDLAAYSSELATLGFDMVRHNHSAVTHTNRLVELLTEATPPASGDTLETLGRLVRMEARAVIRIDSAETENKRMREELAVVHGERNDLLGQRDDLRAQLDGVVKSFSWRLMAPLRRAASLLRRRR
jgi:hypothetical protein